MPSSVMSRSQCPDCLCQLSLAPSLPRPADSGCPLPVEQGQEWGPGVWAVSSLSEDP